MKVTAYVTRDIGRTFGVTHGPITRSDPIRSDPALLQLHRWSPSHHGVTQVTRGARDSAPIVAPSPVTTPDAMMSLTAIEHLDFEPEVPCEDLTATGESADYLAELAEWAAAECPELRRRMMICRKHFEEINAVGALHAPWLPPPARIVQVLR
jgi:hypothetical protein